MWSGADRAIERMLHSFGTAAAWSCSCSCIVVVQAKTWQVLAHQKRLAPGSGLLGLMVAQVVQVVAQRGKASDQLPCLHTGRKKQSPQGSSTAADTLRPVPLQVRRIPEPRQRRTLGTAMLIRIHGVRGRASTHVTNSGDNIRMLTANSLPGGCCSFLRRQEPPPLPICGF